MPSNKDVCLKEVLDAMTMVDEAINSSGLSPEAKDHLEDASISLRNLERNIIRLQTNELTDTLTADATALIALSARIKASSEKLAAVAGIIKKVSAAVETLIETIAGAAGTKQA